MSANEWSLWLLPQASQLQALSAEVQRLAPLFEGSLFVPHVTVQGDLQMDLESLCDVALRLSQSQARCCWQIQAVEHSEHFFRCLYLRLHSSLAFTQLQQAMAQAAGTTQGLSPYPHVSLAYGYNSPDTLPATEQLAAHLHDAWGSQYLVLDRLAVYQSSKSISIAQWQCVAQYPLLQE